MPRRPKKKASPSPREADISPDEIATLVELTGIARPSDAANALRERSHPSTIPLMHYEDLSAALSDETEEADSIDGHMYDEDADPGLLATPLAAHLFITLFWTVVLSMLFVLLDVMTHKQYGDEVSARLELGRLGNFLPGLLLLVFVTIRYTKHPALQLFLFLCSAIGGAYMVHLANVSSYLQVMRRCPPLGTLWIWACIQMDILPTVTSLAGVAAYCWYNGLKVIF